MRKMTRISGLASRQIESNPFNGCLAKDAIDAILALSYEHVAAWWAIKMGLITEKRFGRISIVMMSRTMGIPKARCEALISEIQAVILKHYGHP